MIHDTVPGDAPIRTDVCIVGGGPAGISLALRLAARSGLGVCLLESGGRRFEPEAQDLAAGETVGDPLPPLEEVQVRALGGATWSYGGVSTPLDSTAFEDRPWVTPDGWPFPRSEVDPYEVEAHQLMGVTQEQRRFDIEQAERMFRNAELGPRLSPDPVSFGRPIRFGAEYEGRLAALPNLDVYLHTTVTHLETSGGRVVAATGVSRGRPVRIEARTFVLAAGGIGTPRLLLATGLGGPMVGRHLMDHPRAYYRFAVSADTGLRRLVDFGRTASLRFSRVTLAPETQRQEQLLGWHSNLYFGFRGHDTSSWVAFRRLAITKRSPWNESPFFQDAGGGRMRVRAADVGTVLRRPDHAAIAGLGELVRHPRLLRHVDIVGSVEQVPDPENRVELMDVRDETGMPRARVVWRVRDDERQTEARAAQIVFEELERLDPGVTQRPLDPREGDAEHVITTWHHVGTTRMSTDPSRGVVDADCRVHGIGNLYVASGSVFPTSGSTSPTLLIVQLALRLADHLVGDAAPPVVDPVAAVEPAAAAEPASPVEPAPAVE